MAQVHPDADILQYIIEHQVRPGGRLPTIAELSTELGVSVSKIREELEVVRTLGLVQIKPRTGTLVQDFDFAPAVTLSVLYAVGLNRVHFQDFSKLRNSVELAFWVEAVEQLTPDDVNCLRRLVSCAYDKLNHVPIEVPFEEHRDLHLTFFKRLQNPFVQGILSAYWAAYKAFGLALYAELAYHRKVWTYHERMVELVARREFEAGRQTLEEHMTLLRYRSEAEKEAAERSKIKESSPIYHFFE